MPPLPMRCPATQIRKVNQDGIEKKDEGEKRILINLK